MEIYLLKSTAILAIFWMLYVLFLEKENMHHFKRFYLLASIIAAFYIPLLSITQYVYVTPIDGFEFQNEMIPFAIDDTLAPIEIPFWTLDRILLAMYLIGVTILSIRFLKNIFKMVKTITVNEKQKQSTITFVLLKQLINPHTFFNFIFLNKSKFQKNEVPEEVILHEETHAKQKHSLDILFIELLQIFFWFQPFIWFFKKRIKLNHEFLADQAVIKNGFESANYQKTLLSYSSQQDYSLSNAINYSSIKKRFTVMKTQTPQKKKWLFSLLVLPILGILFYSFSKRDLVEVNKATEDRLSLQTSIAKTTDNEASEALMSEYKSFINTFNKTKIIYGDAYERAIIIYDQLMSEAQRASVEKYPDRIIPMPNLSRIKAKSPTSEQLEAFKNPKVYAIWIDNKHVSNSELNNYAVKDFVHVSGSHVYKNARSKKFPQPNQYHLFTKAGFKTVYEDSQLNRYRKASKKYTNAISKYLKGPQNDNSELIILKIKTDAIYETFSEDDINKNNIKTTPPVPAEYITPKKSNQQKPPTAKEIADYNAWAKNVRSKFVKLSDDAVWMPPIEEKDLVKNLRIYSKMTKKQRDASEENPYPNLDPDYIEKNISASQKTKPTKQEIAEYNTWAKQMKAKFKKMPESDKVEGYPHMINDEVFRRHNAVYDRMSETQKKNAESLPEAVLVTEWPMPTVVRVNTVSNQQNPPTPKEIASYNAWAKKLNTKIESAAKGNGDYPIIKQKDIERHKSIYSRMTDKQKTDAEVFPNIPPPPPPPPALVKAYKNGKKKTLNEIIKQTPKSAKSGYEVLDNGESHYYIIYGGKKTYYNKDGYITDDKGNILPPPPPAPVAPQKSKGGPNAKDYKMVFAQPENEIENEPKSRDYLTRKLILKAAENQKIPIKYTLNGKTSDAKTLKNYILKNETVNAKFSKGKVNKLDFSERKGSKMTETQLQNVYTQLFDNYDKRKTIVVTPMKTKEDCLVIPQSFFTNNGNTLNIKCIEHYAENKLQIFDRWGKLIYSKDNYNNDWNGTVEKQFASKDTDKPIGATYYYVLSSPELEESRAGYILINTKKVESVSIETNEVTRTDGLIVNGKTLTSFGIKMTSEEFKKLEITGQKFKIESFSLKIAGIATQTIKGNKLNNQSKVLFNNKLNHKYPIQILNIKSSNETKIRPFTIEITD